MTTLDTSKQAVTKAAQTAVDATSAASTRAKGFTTTTAKAVVDSPAVAKTVGATTEAAQSVVESPVVTKTMEATSQAAKSVNDHSLVIRVKEFSTSAAEATTEVASVVFESVSSATEAIFEMVSDLPLGGKNVGERVEQTVDTVQDKIDVEQIQDQVAKLRHQIDGVVETWQESFRPSTAHKAETKATRTVKNTQASTRTATKKAQAPTRTATKKAQTPTKKATTATKKKATTTAKKTQASTKTATKKATTTAKK